MKSRYGVSPWGNWFVSVLDGYKMGARLDRGKSYATTGKVLSLEFNAGRTGGGSACAKVKGNYRPFYRVEIDFPPLKEAEQVYRMIEDDPLLLASIAAGELPESFLKKLQKKDIKLIPEHWREMKRSCNCPDWGDPCKHLAALYFILAREIDSDPHILFRLRGMELAERFGKSVIHQIALPFEISFASKAVKIPAETLNLEEIPNCGGLISSLLPQDSFFSNRNFAAVMAEFYHSCVSYQVWEKADEQNYEETEHIFSRSHWTIISKIEPGAEPVLEAEDINGNKKRYSLYDAFENFVQFSSEDGTVSYTFLFYLFKFLNLVCSSGAFVPYVLTDSETLSIIWRPFETLPPVSQMIEEISKRECGMLTSPPLFRIGMATKKAGAANRQKVSGRSVVDLLSSAFLNEYVRRRFLVFKDNFNKERSGDEHRQLLNLFFLGYYIEISAPAKRSLPSLIDQWLSVLHINFSAYNYSLTVKNSDAKKDHIFNNDFSLSMDIIVEENNSEQRKKRIPLSKCKNFEMLRAPVALSNYLPEIKNLSTRSNVQLSDVRLVSFLDSAAPLLARLGIEVVLPKALARELKPRLVIKGKSGEGSLVRYLDLNALQAFEWQIAIGDQVMTPEDFKKLVKQKKALVRFKDGFVKMEPEEFKRLLKKAQDGTPDKNDFLKAHFSGDTVLAVDTRETIDNLFREHNFPVPVALNAKLRPYQKRGFNWVCSLFFSGFGCILADDMGLGKTVQAITAILLLKKEGLLKNGCLVVAPAALLNNWENELDKFAPSLKHSRYHGSARRIDRKKDIFLTTYHTALKDEEKLKEETFSLLLVDEAHLMKNAETRISKTVKQLRSQYRLALSGTPVENRLEDLRSLFDFILPGFLGTAAHFREEYRLPIEVMRNREKAESLRKITSPFLLRRLKTDKTIIKDLPEKIITNEYAVLEKNQAALYESVVSVSIDKSAKLEPKERSALILSMLTSLKQICDHPRVFDKESPAVSGLSGKAQLLLTLLEEILANCEKTLVFSQYVETLDCLEKIIKKELGEAPLLYHGGLGQTIRSGIIDRFQNDPASRILLISLKAGGLGLNLTKASRVIHYDLWYNPAVENQATDRAFRIGQKRSVFVHRLITKNSFEEKIDAMITSKKELADMTVASGESWLARMSHEELKSLFDK